MSAVNMHPPQTYSRLFRPWDTIKSTIASSCCSTNERKIDSSKVKQDCFSHERQSFKSEAISTRAMHIADNDLESASSSSSKSSYEDGLNCNFTNSPPSRMETLNHSNGGLAPAMIVNPFNATHLYNQTKLEKNQQQMQIMAGITNVSDINQIYFAAAASTGVSIPSNSAYIHPYTTLGLMEQEYARVMAEDAHLKAINARKQRPKKFKCPHCEVAFSNNGQLKGHIRIHTGERPFKCDVETCGKTFTRNEELTRHKRIHTGLRPYPCTCGKKFGRRDHLKKHMKTHMPQERQVGPTLFVPMYPYLYGF